MASLGESRGLGGEIKLFPPPVFKGEHEKWEDWSWQLKAYVALYKPVAQELMSRIEGSSSVIDDEATQREEDAYYQGLELVKFAKALHYLLANLTDESARLIVRLNEDGNGFETWRQLYDRFALPSRAKGVSLLSRLLEHQFRDAHFEADLTEFIVLKNKHEKATNSALSDDLLITLLMNKTRGQLQQHLRLQANSLRTFDQVLVIVKEYYQSRHLVNGRLGHTDSGGPAPMDIGAAWKGKGKGKGKSKGTWKGKGKGLMTKGKGKGFSKGKGKSKGLKGKGKGRNDGCFICGSHDHWANNCPRANTQGALWQIEEGTDWNDESEDWNAEQENGENHDWSEYQGALFEDSAWTEDDWSVDWWYDDGCDWSSDWSWYDDSLWQWPVEYQAALPPPPQMIAPQAAAAKAASIAPQAPAPHTAAAVIAGPPGLAPLSPSDQIANDSLIASARVTREVLALHEQLAQELRVNSLWEH